jgi:hypothetical protein
MKTHRTLTILVLAAAAVLAASPAAQAVCIQTGASQADIDLWNTHGCWRDFYLWEYQAYDMHDSDWSGRGWNDACNNRLEYPKHWNAAYLVTYGLADNYNYSFHGTVDYRALGEQPSNHFHGSQDHIPSDRTDIFGSYQVTATGSNKLATACPVYNPAVQNANPASRAGEFMHEAWHGWLSNYNWDNGSYGGHRAMQGNCTACNCCDYYYWHGIGRFDFGELWKTDGTAATFHSPNQVQVEWLCDVADYPQSWVPNSVRLAAQTDANTRAAGRFINGPGYTCGSPRPW